ncbi:MAG: RNA-binding S4 domain-containing protein [Proteobacteria bacterium]|nr:RNA-binding S4 domain-containing protein [Pseudomonadota bacterium]
MNEAEIRIDKWLWYARFFKTRSLAQAFVQSGKVRRNEIRIGKPSDTVKPGDVLTFVRGDDVRIVEVVQPGARRGPAPEAATLYKDLTPPRPKKALDPDAPAPTGKRDPGAGRPTKRERRAIDRLSGD